MQHEDEHEASPSNINDDDRLLRQWSPAATRKEVARLDQQIAEARRDLGNLKAHGIHAATTRQHSMDALETKRLTLTEILRRMEEELNEKDAYEYGNVLAEVFGQRQVFAQRAIGLEALLCQFMHQMLAKQHQLKIMKKAAKAIQDIYRKNKNLIKGEYHSYEALAVQVETSRLSTESLLEDIFVAQQSLLQKLLDPEAYVKSRDENEQKEQPKKNFVSLAPVTRMLDYGSPLSPSRLGNTTTPSPAIVSPLNPNIDASYYTTLNLSNQDLTPEERKQKLLERKQAIEQSRRQLEERRKQLEQQRSTPLSSARERRRMIERQRLASGAGKAMGASQQDVYAEPTISYEKVNRAKMRELEKLRAESPIMGNTEAPVHVVSPGPDDGDANADEQRRSSDYDVAREKAKELLAEAGIAIEDGPTA